MEIVLAIIVGVGCFILGFFQGAKITTNILMRRFLVAMATENVPTELAHKILDNLQKLNK